MPSNARIVRDFGTPNVATWVTPTDNLPVGTITLIVEAADETARIPLHSGRCLLVFVSFTRPDLSLGQQ
jgi:hypothetical protein